MFFECISVSINSNGACDMAVRDYCASLDIPNDGTYLLFASNAGIADGEILNIGIRA